MAEMVALAASNLKKPPAAGEAKRDIPIPKKGGPNKEETKEAPQARTSNMDALKAQIMLRKQAMNPGAAKKGGDDQEESKRSNLAALSMKMSKFANDVDEDEDESKESSSSDDD